MTKDLHIKFKTQKEMFSGMESGLESKAVFIQSKEEIYFETYKDFQKFLFPRLGILLAIKSHQPKSKYELSKLVNRDVSTIIKDCNALEAIGFITLEETDDPRGSKIPHLKYDYNRIVVHAPILGSHALLLAA